MSNSILPQSSNELVDSQASPERENIIDSSTGQFIDPLFAVIIAAGLSETIVIWVKTRDIPELYVFLTVLTGYINILLSWFGYHKSIRKRPIIGVARFIITVTLLPLYLLTIIICSPDMYQYNLLVYLFVFLLWFLWDCLKCYEYNEPMDFISKLFRIPNSIIYLLVSYVFFF